jgi:spore coat protein CotF
MNRMQTNMSNQNVGAQGGFRYGAHEFLETQEALRAKAAHIELYGVLINDAQDPHLRDILTNQQRRMVQGFQQCASMLMSHGVQPAVSVPHTPHANVYEQPQIGLNNPTFPSINPNAKQLSDFTIATTALLLHKAGAMFATNWTLESVAPALRACHATSANTCQEMAYELFQYMNYKGYYQVPQLADHTMNTMMQAVQGMNMGGMGAGMGGMTTGVGMTGAGTSGTNFHMNTFTGQAPRYTTTSGGDYNARY